MNASIRGPMQISLFKKGWNWLVEPNDAVTGELERQRARLLTSLLVPMTIITLVGIVSRAMGSPGSDLVLPFMLLLTSYLISRTRHFTWAAVLTILALSAPTVVSVLTNEDPNVSSISVGYMWIAIPLLLASLMLPSWMVMAYNGLVLGASLLMPILVSGLEFTHMIGPLAFVVSLGLFFTIASILREQDRQRIADELQRREQAESEVQKQFSLLTIVNNELQKATREAEEANRLKSEFLATMSHEFRTPLNSVIGYTDYLIESPDSVLSTKQEDYLGRIMSNGKRLLFLIDDLLDISKIEAGHLILQDESYNPISLLEEMRLQVQGLAQDKGLQLTTRIDPDLPPDLLGDPNRIQQIVINLLSNAIKFTEKGSVEVTLLRQDAETWQIVVSDTGLGISQDDQSYIFDAFRQIDSGPYRKQGGTGLGLAIVNRLVNMMGGSIKLESELGQGSTFTVTLPLRSATELQRNTVQHGDK